MDFFVIDTINRYAGKMTEWENKKVGILQVKYCVVTTFFFLCIFVIINFS